MFNLTLYLRPKFGIWLMLFYFCYIFLNFLALAFKFSFIFLKVFAVQFLDFLHLSSRLLIDTFIHACFLLQVSKLVKTLLLRFIWLKMGLPMVYFKRVCSASGCHMSHLVTNFFNIMLELFEIGVVLYWFWLFAVFTLLGISWRFTWGEDESVRSSEVFGNKFLFFPEYNFFSCAK